MHNSLTDIIYQARCMARGVRCKFGMYFTRGTYHRNISCCQSGHSVMARSALPCAAIKYIRQYVTRAHNHPHYLTPVVNTYYQDIALSQNLWMIL